MNLQVQVYLNVFSFTLYLEKQIKYNFSNFENAFEDKMQTINAQQNVYFQSIFIISQFKMKHSYFTIFLSVFPFPSSSQFQQNLKSPPSKHEVFSNLRKSLKNSLSQDVQFQPVVAFLSETNIDRLDNFLTKSQSVKNLEVYTEILVCNSLN